MRDARCGWLIYEPKRRKRSSEMGPLHGEGVHKEIAECCDENWIFYYRLWLIPCGHKLWPSSVASTARSFSFPFDRNVRHLMIWLCSSSTECLNNTQISTTVSLYLTGWLTNKWSDIKVLGRTFFLWIVHFCSAQKLSRAESNRPIQHKEMPLNTIAILQVASFLRNGE